MEYHDRIKKKVSEIMYRNPKVFPIVDVIMMFMQERNIWNKMSGNEFETMVRFYIETRIGLDYIVRKKIDCVDEVRAFALIAPLTDASLDESLVKSICFLYTTSLININEFDDCFQGF